MLTPMLLNELQRQALKTQEIARKLSEQTASLQRKDAALAAQQHEIDMLKTAEARVDVLAQRVTTLEQQLQAANSDRLQSLARK